MSTPVADPLAAHAAPPAAPPRAAPLASRIVDTLFSPGKVFEGFRDGAAPWLGPVLVCAAVLVLVALARPLFVSDRQMAEFALQKMSEMGAKQLPTAEDMEKGIAVQTAIGIGASVVWLFLRVWLVGLILFGVYALALGGRNDVRPYAAVASHAFLVSTLGFALVAALQYATGRLDLALDASLLAPGLDPQGLAVGVLRAITPWTVWLVALLALGGATVNRRRGWLGVAALLLSMHLALALAFALLMQVARGRAAAG